MASLPSKVLGLALVAAFASAVPAHAKVRKHKNVAHAAPTVAVKPGYWGTNLVPAGPLYFSGVYLGDDPDPNIRFQLMRQPETGYTVTR